MDVSPDFFEWIKVNANVDPAVLRLKYAGKEGTIDYSAAITQIECRRRFGRKLADTLASFPQFFFPSTLAGEQASSDKLASYHTSLVPEGMAIVDLTAGLGIDVLHMAQRASSVVAVERNPELVEALRYNAVGLKVQDVVEPICADCIDFIDECIAQHRHFDMAFIDPARRSTDGGRLFALADCSPDVVSLLPKLAQICRMLVIKASPMLDISHTIASMSPLPQVVSAAGTPTECKELVIITVFDAPKSDETVIEAVTMMSEDTVIFSFTIEQERTAKPVPVIPPVKAGDVVCEPFPALMKAGAFKLLAERFGLRGFHDNTRLLFASDAKAGFPGSLWRVEQVMPYSSSIIKRFKSKYPAISIVTRNFGMSADALRGRLGVKEASGNLRLFAVTDAEDRKIMIVANRI